MQTYQHDPSAAEPFFEGIEAAIEIQMVYMEFTVLSPGGNIEYQFYILRKLIICPDQPTHAGDILKIQVIFGKSLFQDRAVIPETLLKTTGPKTAVAQQKVDVFGIFFCIRDVFWTQSGSRIPLDPLHPGACMPRVDVGLILFFLKIIQLSCIVHPDSRCRHVKHKPYRIRPDDDKLRRESASGLLTDPVEPVGDPAADTFFCNVPGIVSESAAVEITEDDLLSFNRQQETELPGPPDQCAVKCGIQSGQQGV